MHLRPFEHLENCRLKCKMHTQERQLRRFCILQLIYKENLTRGFSQNRNELEKSIPHIPSVFNKASVSKAAMADFNNKL